MDTELHFAPKLNTSLLKSNITFDELQEMKPKHLTRWAEILRTELKDNWDYRNIPPQIGKSDLDIIDSFGKLKDFDISGLWVEDLSNQYELGVIKNFTKMGSCVNQFFPHLLKSRVRGYSIYDFLTDENLYNQFYQRVIKKTRFDGMYLYTKNLYNNQSIADTDYFILWYKEYGDKYGFYLEPQNPLNNEVIRDKLYLSPSSIKNLMKEGILEEKHFSNIVLETELNENDGFYVRYYNKEQRIFPNILQVLRLGLGQVAVNFNPLTARLIYEHFLTDTNSTQIIYDPSAGWGGRLLGSLCSNRLIHYIGTDVNTNNKGCYEQLGEVYNKFCNGGNSYEIFYEGSELIHKNPSFQKYKGRLDLCFTSPPYFARELYSQDKEQSVLKYPTYGEWKDKFLSTTIKNCFDYLKENRYMLINISNIKIYGHEFIPLVEDVISISSEIGLDYCGDIGMCMSRNMGLDVNNSLSNWNDITNDTKYKTEPILVFRKNYRG